MKKFALKNKRTQGIAWPTVSDTADGAWQTYNRLLDAGGPNAYQAVRGEVYECVELEITEKSNASPQNQGAEKS